MMDEYLTYLRKSQFDREFGELSVSETLERHRIELEKLAVTRKLHVVEVLEEVVSGESLASRPQMQRLLDMVATGRYAGVICRDIDRLSRGDSMDSGYIMQVFQSAGCLIITPTKTYDLNNTNDEQFTDMKFLFSRYELKMITGRMQSGRLASSKAGKFIGVKDPYGYKRVKLKGEKGWSLEIVESEAEVIKLIFDMYTRQNMGYTSIAERLNDMGISAGARRKQWVCSSIQWIISSVLYTGRIKIGKCEKKKVYKDGVMRKTYSKPRLQEIVEGRHPAIISMETFERAQDVRKGRPKPPTDNRQLRNEFAGLIRCGICGSPVRRQDKSKRSPIYTCTRRGCTCRSCVSAPVEAEILAQMRKWLEGYTITVTQVQATDMSASIEAVKKEIEELSAQEDKLCEFLEKGIYTPDMYTKRYATLRMKLEKAECSLKSLTRHQNEATERFNEAVNAVPLAQGLLDSYERLTVPERNAVWRQLLDRVEYSRIGDDVTAKIYPRLSVTSNSL